MYPFRFKIFKNVKIILVFEILCLVGFFIFAEFKNIINIKSSISIYDTKKHYRFLICLFLEPYHFLWA